jgi:hypothetical protein
VRLDRCDLQRFGLLPHRFTGGREEDLELLRVELLLGLVFRRLVEWRVFLARGIIEVRGEGLTRIVGNVTGGSRRQVRSIT